MVYVRRTVDLELDDLFPHVAAIALDGPKAVGKTTTAAQRAADIVNLDRTAERVPLEADPGLLLSRPRPLLIDVAERARGVGRRPPCSRSGSFRKPVPFGGKCDAPGRCNRSLGRRPNRQASHAPYDS